MSFRWQNRILKLYGALPYKISVTTAGKSYRETKKHQFSTFAQTQRGSDFIVQKKTSATIIIWILRSTIWSPADCYRPLQNFDPRKTPFLFFLILVCEFLAKTSIFEVPWPRDFFALVESSGNQILINFIYCLVFFIFSLKQVAKQNMKTKTVVPFIFKKEKPGTLLKS